VLKLTGTNLFFDEGEEDCKSVFKQADGYAGGEDGMKNEASCGRLQMSSTRSAACKISLM
jgi:hypothetical protein